MGDRESRIRLALQGLLPIVAMTCSEFPTDPEREEALEAIMMADTLVAGGGKGRGALTAVAKAVWWLTGLPGPGLVLVGHHWHRRGRGVTSHEAAEGCPYRCEVTR